MAKAMAASGRAVLAAKEAPAAAPPPAQAPATAAPAPSVEASPPPIPKSASASKSASVPAAKAKDIAASPAPNSEPQRRAARRRPAGPVRGKVAANDDVPSIGGLIYALDQNPSNKPFLYAGLAGALWILAGIVFTWVMFSGELAQGAGVRELLARPTTFFTAATILTPVAVFYFLALLAWRSEELRLRSSTMTEVAVRLAEPDRMAEQSVASLGQAVRRQVSFMNDAVSRALGRAGELEALVHNEVSALERSYEENERKIRGLIKELTGEREALLGTSERVTDTLKSLGTDIPHLIDKLSNQQIKLAQIIQGASENLSSLEGAVGQSAIRLESTLGERTGQLQNVLENYTSAIGSAIGHRTEEMQGVLDTYTSALAEALGSRTDQFQALISDYMHSIESTLSGRSETLQAVFEEYGRALDTTLANRAQALDFQLVERTRAIDAAFNDRLRLFDESIMRSTLAIDTAVNEKAGALTKALDQHAKSFSETMSRSAVDMDEALIQGINSVRRSSESITRQSLKAIEGLASQSELLRNVSENLLGQINSVTNRFENQSQTIMKAANSLESANYKIDLTLQNRHADLSRTLEQMSGKADEFGRFMEGYSSSIEGSVTEAEARARAAAEQLRLGAEATKRTALAEIDQIKVAADTGTQRALEDLRRRFTSVSNAVDEQIKGLSTRVDVSANEIRQRAARTVTEIAAEQARLREQIERMPAATRESTDAMRRTLEDQIKALDQLSSLGSRTALQRDVAPPVSPLGSYPPPPAASSAPRRGGEPLQRPSPSQPYGRPSDPLARGAPLIPSRTLPAPQPPMPAEPRETWSLGDLLARASRDEESHHVSGGESAAYHLDIGVIARALDPATTAAIWSRVRTGQRGVMVRSIYSTEGKLAFDEVSRRYQTDPDLKRTVDRFLAEFEQMKADGEMKDPTGRLVESQIVSDSGRVYLFLAHASGRLI